eukprot:IDg17133t1
MAQSLSSVPNAKTANAFNTTYTDTGLFGIYATGEAPELDDIAHAIMFELVRNCTKVDEQQLANAKIAVKTSMLAQLDGPTAVAEEIGRQLLVYGRRIPIAEWFARIDAVDSAAIQRISNKYIFDREMAVTAMGPIHSLPDYNWLRRRNYTNLTASQVSTPTAFYSAGNKMHKHANGTAGYVSVVASTLLSGRQCFAVPLHCTRPMYYCSRSYFLGCQRIALKIPPKTVFQPTKMVFTGIVEEMGTVIAIENLGADDGGVTMTVSSAKAVSDASIGDSIAVNGTCLSITEIAGDALRFGLVPETLQRTNLGKLLPGHQVNIERSMGANSRFGGHIVQGHVDCTGTIEDIRRDKDALWFTIHIPKQFMKYIVEKGYIAVDGASLTVCDVLPGAFTFTMIPITQESVVTA